MSTMNKTIDYVDRLKPNIFENEDKYTWIARLDGMISTEVHRDEPPVSYNLPEEADKELLIPAPYDDLYAFYISAMIDLYNKEYAHYNNSVLVFQERLEAYKADYIRKHPVCRANHFRNVMG